jgi:uncharacterized membrane protein YphA (DoxX/SURF4 family)
MPGAAVGHLTWVEVADIVVVARDIPVAVAAAVAAIVEVLVAVDTAVGVLTRLVIFCSTLQ